MDPPLDGGTGVSFSPDGKWLVADLPLAGGTGVSFSPDGKWLMSAGGRLWEVGTWREAQPILGGSCFSPDGQLIVAVDAKHVFGLVETEMGRTLARLESPDLCGVSGISFSPDGSHLEVSVSGLTFSPDGSRLVVTTNDGPAVHVWDLRAIRKNLLKMGLDWDAPAYSREDQADPSRSPLPPLPVDLGPSPRTWQPEPGFFEPFITHLEIMLARRPDQRRIRDLLARYCNNYAWGLAIGPASTRDPRRALALARRAVALDPSRQPFINTLGVALYRAGHYAEAIPVLERSLAEGRGDSDARDLFFLAMAYHRLGNADQAGACFNRAERWLAEHENMPWWDTTDLTHFRAEAEVVLAGPAGELPDNVFAGP
jgi:hypothetical protein